MKTYSKRALTIPEQIALLQARGVEIEDPGFAERVFSNVSYYRFSGYLYPFRKNDGTDDYEPGTSFRKCWEIYHFDRRLRLCVLDAVERVEVAIKAQVVNTLSVKYGPFSYRDPSALKDKMQTNDKDRYKSLLDLVDGEINKSQEEFVKHFQATYDTKTGLPLWMPVVHLVITAETTLPVGYHGPHQATA